jgi:Ca2+-binding RTX toxin-like protein
MYFAYRHDSSTAGFVFPYQENFRGAGLQSTYVIGGITGTSGLPGVVTPANFQTVIDAMLAKTTELQSAPMTVTLDQGAQVAILGGDGNDLFDIRGGNGRVVALGNGGNDTLLGSFNADTMDGGSGNDSFDGSTGADSLTGGGGSDTIVGGNGADTFGGLLSDMAGDRIVGISGSDRIYLGQSLNSVANVRLVAAGADTALEIDSDNNGSFETVMTLSGTVGGAITLSSDGVRANSALGFTVLPTFDITAAVAKLEGAAGTTAFVFTVTRDGDVSGTSTVNWAVTADTGDADFVGAVNRTGQTLTFAPGETSQTVTVNVAGDAVIEGDETFTLTLSAATGATINTAAGLGTIQTDDIAPPTGLMLTTASDTGASSTDNVTRVAGVTITGSATAGASVTIYDTDGVTQLGSAVATNGTFSIVLQDGYYDNNDDYIPLAQGAHAYTAKTYLNGRYSGPSSGLSVTLDSLAPAAPSAPDLAAASDDGVSNTDNSTAVATPTFTGTAEAGATVTLYDSNGTTVLGTGAATGGNWSIASSTLSLGAHTLTAKAVDLAGNAGTASASLGVTIVAPPPAPDPGPAPSTQPTLVSSGGNETITGASGDDSLAGSTGADSIVGGLGADQIDGGSGDDSLAGGEGADNLRGLSDNDSIDGGSGTDTVNGNQGGDTVRGGAGADVVFGGQGSDLVDGGEGDDSHVNGNLGADSVYGGAGDDKVYGGQGDDSVYGGAGDDRLSGDLGNDNLFGGAGADGFAFGRGSGLDWVADFNFAEGDRILLAPGQTYTVVTFDGQVMLDLGGGDVIGLAGVSSFNPAFVSFG